MLNSVKTQIGRKILEKKGTVLKNIYVRLKIEI